MGAGKKNIQFFDKLSHTNSLVMKDYAHHNFSENIFIDEYGIEVLKGCGFTAGMLKGSLAEGRKAKRG